jgi:hypothetical protein
MSICEGYDAANMPTWRALVRNIPRGSIRGYDRGGRRIRYVTARTIMNILDDVVGPENWWDEYEPIRGGIICRLSVRFPGGNVVTKCDVGGNQGVADPGDDDKSGYSDSLKRAACKFGIARVLYGEGVPVWARDAAALAGPAPLARDVPEAPREVPVTFRGEAAPPTGREVQPPRGKAAPAPERPGFYLYRKYIGSAMTAKTLAALIEYGDKHHFPERMVRWDADQCREAVDAVSAMGFDI